MSSASERLRHVDSKVERAKKHIADLRDEATAFVNSKPYTIGARQDPQNRKLVYYIEAVNAQIPVAFALIAGDAIQNLVSALDHLAYQLVCSDTNDVPPHPSSIYFPIADSAEEYEARKNKKLKGAKQPTLIAIDGLAPFKGGNDVLWMLSRLNNVEKHRLLLTVGSQTAGIHLGQLIAAWGTFPESAREVVESLDFNLVPADGGFPLQEGSVLYIGAVDEKPNPKQRFTLEVALNEPGICEGQSLIKTLDECLAAVEGTVAALTTRLN